MSARLSHTGRLAHTEESPDKCPACVANRIEGERQRRNAAILHGALDGLLILVGVGLGYLVWHR